MEDTFFEGLSKPELTYLVEEFDAIPRGGTKKALADALVERNVGVAAAKDKLRERRERIEQAHPNYQEETITKEDSVVLIRMRRANPTFHFRGYKFTREDPFVLMKEPDADAIMRFETGFVMATPQEARDFYGRS